MEYTPFVDRKGNKRQLKDLRFEDILRIEENGVEEGYKVEFKRQWDDNFIKKHLCQTISSFANAEGGWLIVGVEDGTGKYYGIEKKRTDFSQTISQKVSEISPMPKYDCRYIHEKNNRNKGVLVVQVYEGIDPPYVYNGTIYTRSGSSKVPIKSDRGSIDELINKKTRFNEKFKEFCVNRFVSEKETFPYCTIYLYNSYNTIEYSNYDEKIKRIKNEFEGIENNGRLIDSIDSVLHLGSDVVSANSSTSIEEYFIDDNIKLYVPFFKINNERLGDWIATVSDLNSKINMSDMVIVDGIITYITLNRLLGNALRYLKKTGAQICDYKIVFEYKHIKNTVFYHKHNFNVEGNKDIFINNTRNGNFYVCNLSEVVTEPLSFISDIDVEKVDSFVSDLLYIRFLNLFGIDVDSFIEIMTVSNDMYNQQTYSSETY